MTVPEELPTFHPGSALHLLTVLLSLAAMAGLAWRGRAIAGTPGETRLRRAFVVGILLVQVIVLGVSFAPANFDPRSSFPLHLCDVAIFVAAAALWTRRRIWRTLTYFWALGLSTQAFLTPTLEQGPERIGFWLFWIAHTQVVGTAVYEVVVGRYRPTYRDWLIACGAMLVYGLGVLPIDLAFDLPYGFVGPEGAGDSGTVLDWLPAWPWSLPVLFVLASAWMALLWLVWPCAAHLRSCRKL